MRKRAHTSGLPSRTPPAPHPHRGSGLRMESPVLLLQMGRLHRPSSARPAPRMCVCQGRAVCLCFSRASPPALGLAPPPWPSVVLARPSLLHSEGWRRGASCTAQPQAGQAEGVGKAPVAPPVSPRASVVSPQARSHRSLAVGVGRTLRLRGELRFPRCPWAEGPPACWPTGSPCEALPLSLCSPPG